MQRINIPIPLSVKKPLYYVFSRVFECCEKKVANFPEPR